MAILAVIDLSAGQIERVEVRADGRRISVQLTAGARREATTATGWHRSPEPGDPLTRFMAVLGRHLTTSSFDDALELASREDPAGYASYRRSLEGRR